MKFLSLSSVLFINSFLQIVTSQMVTQCTQNGVFALTFDDGVTQYSEQMLDILKEKGVKATFFYIGSNLESDEQKKIAKRAFDEGHQIASHTWSHPELSKLSTEKVKEEMQKTEDNIEKAIGKKVRYMRNPFLDSSEAVDSILRGMDYIQVGVNLDTFDWKVKDTEPAKIFSTIDDAMKTADVNTQSFISLQHDLTDPKVAKIGEIIDVIRSKNFKFVTSEECLGKGPAYRDSSASPFIPVIQEQTVPQAQPDTDGPVTQEQDALQKQATHQEQASPVSEDSEANNDWSEDETKGIQLRKLNYRKHSRPTQTHKLHPKGLPTSIPNIH